MGGKQRGNEPLNGLWVFPVNSHGWSVCVFCQEERESQADAAGQKLPKDARTKTEVEDNNNAKGSVASILPGTTLCYCQKCQRQ